MSAIPLRTLIVPAVEHISVVYGAAGGPPPMAMMAAIGLQESEFAARDQLELQNGRLVPGAIGPACGFWQFEKNGGVKGVMTHPASRTAARDLTLGAGVPFEADAIWRHFATLDGDELAAAYARLLLLTDPQPLPAPRPESEQASFDYYLRIWRPGAWFNSNPGTPEGAKKRTDLRLKWGRNWTAALAALAEYGAGEAAGAPAAAPVAAAVPAASSLEQRLLGIERKLAQVGMVLGS